MPSPLKKLVIDKIGQLGIKKAAAYFDKKEATIRLWQRTESIPISAVERVMADGPTDIPGAPTPDPVPVKLDELTSIHEFVEPQSGDPGLIWEQLSQFNTRLAAIEEQFKGGAQEAKELVKPAVPGYGFPTAPPMIGPVPPGGLQPVVQQQPVTPPPTPPAQETPLMAGQEPYLPSNRSWAQPHKRVETSKV